MTPRSRSLLLSGLLASALVLGCQAPSHHPLPGPHALSASLAEPQGSDWSLQRVSSRDLTRRQEAHMQRRVLAFPTASWTNGIDLTAYGCQPGDTVPNGQAIAFPASGPQLNQLFVLSQAGKFIRLNRQTPTTFVTLDLGRAFSRTAITLSPNTSRAYVVADDGTLSVVDTASMKVLATRQVAGGYGTVPTIDRVASMPDDTRDVLYVPANDGHVHAFTITPDGAGGVAVTATAVHAVATDVTPLSGTRKLAAPAVVVAGLIHIGDQAGNFHAYDTANPAASLRYDLGAPITTAPALELQDGRYTTLTDAAGQPKEVPYGRPVYAFVNAGASCAWLNLHDASITYSMSLRIDDNDPTRTFGYLRDYAYSTAGSTELLAAVDGGNLNTESPDRALPGYGTIWSNDHLVPAETNTFEENGEAKGGPVQSYVRWRAAKTFPEGTVIASAKLGLTPAADQACRVPVVKTSSPFFAGTSLAWQSNALTNANRPAVGPAVGRYMSGGISGRAGNANFRTRKTYEWDVTSAFSTPRDQYALAVAHNAGGDAVLWPEGPIGGGTGMRAKKDYQVEAVKFRNNPLNANSAPASATDTRPLLTLQIAATRLPTATLETPPVIDSVNQRIYVFYTNALYAISFASPEAWSDTDPTGAKHTLFNMAHFGEVAHGGGTHNAKQRFVGNFTAPLLGHGAMAAYVMSRYPSVDGDAPTTWNYAISKINLPLSPTTNQLSAISPTFQGIGRGASHAMLLDPLNKLNRGGSFYFGLGNGKMYKFDL